MSESRLTFSATTRVARHRTVPHGRGRTDLAFVWLADFAMATASSSVSP